MAQQSHTSEMHQAPLEPHEKLVIVVLELDIIDISGTRQVQHVLRLGVGGGGQTRVIQIKDYQIILRMSISSNVLYTLQLNILPQNWS